MKIDVKEHTYKSRTHTYRRRTSEIILHCTATPEGRDYTVEDIDGWHKTNGWSCIGYHYVVYRDGSIHRGRPMGAVGAHCKGHNSRSVGVVYVGGTDADGKPKDTRTEAQRRALVALVGWLLNFYSLPVQAVRGHCEFAAKACPCFNVEEFRASLLTE